MTNRQEQNSLETRRLPIITIGITCYNADATIVRSVESALRQDWPKKEIIIVDDGSRDESKAILDRLGDQYKDIRIIIHPTNRGYAGALNTIVKEAQGEFIAIFDDDDYSIADRLTDQWNRIRIYEQENNCDLVFCYSNRNVVKPGRTSPDHIAYAIGRQAREPHGIAVANYIFGHTYDPKFVWGMFGSCTLMARRNAFTKVGPFDETFRRCAEWDYAIRAAFLGCHFISVNKSLITQYKTPTTDKSGNIPLQYSLQIRKKYRKYLTDHGTYWASCAIAYCRFHGGKGRLFRSYFYMALACLAAPKILVEKSRWRLKAVVWR